MPLDAFDPEYAPTNALLTAPGRDAGTELIAQIRDRPAPGIVCIRDFRHLETRTLPADDLTDEFPTATEIVCPDDLDFPCHCAGDTGDGYMVGRYTVRDDEYTVTVEKFLFNDDTGTDLVTPTNAAPTRDVVEFLHGEIPCILG